MPRRRQQSIAPTTLIEIPGAGVISDGDAAALKDGQLVACTDWMLDRPGVAYKRGGSVQVGGDCGAQGNIWVDVAEFPTLGQSEVLAWNTDLKLYRNVAGVWTATGAPTAFGADTGYAPRMKPVIVADPLNTSTGGMMMWGTAAGNHTPRVYEGDGAAVRAIDVGSGLDVEEGGRYMVFHKGRLVLAASTNYENRMWFSPDIVTGVETAWDLTNSYIDFDHNITGLAALQNVLLVFSRDHLVRLSGTAPPPGGNMTQGTIANVGCCDSRSLATWNDSAIWASPQGCYMSNGTGVNDLTLEGGFKRAWRDAMSGYLEESDAVVGTAHGQFYIVSVQDAVTFVLDIPRRIWWEVDPNSGHANSMVSNPLTGNNLYVSDGHPYVADWAPFFTPSASYRTDVGGTAPAASLTTRIIHGGSVGLKSFRDGRARYRLDSVSSAATMGITSRSEADNSTFVTNSLAEGLLRDRVQFDISGEAEGVQLTVTQTDACDLCELYGFEIDMRALPLSRGGAE